MRSISENQDRSGDPGPRPPHECGGVTEPLWSLETLGKVTEGVAHDFNNILATISGFAELILNADEHRADRPKEVEAFARYILQAALTGQSAVRQLRGFTRRYAGEKESLDLHELLRQSIGMVRGALGDRISITSDFIPRPAMVRGCRGLLHNVFINLFFNARDAMPEGGGISVRTYPLETGAPAVKGIPDFLVVSVKDTGGGMSEEVRERVFEPFFTTKGAQGSGMGLANVDATIKAHGGWITVESAPGNGSEFKLHFPIEA